MPLRQIPGNASPTASSGSPSASALISSAILPIISSDGIACNRSAPPPSTGYDEISPTTESPSTTPHAMCSLTTTPMLRGIFSLKPRELVNPVERGGFVAFGQRRVVEHRIDEIVDLAAQRQNRLPD